MATTPDGGIGQYSYCLAAALQQRGTPVRVLMHDSPRYELREFPHDHAVIPVLRMPQSNWTRLPLAFGNALAFTRYARDSDIVHFQWHIGLRFDRMNWSRLKRAGKRIVYTAHNIVPHEQNPGDIEHYRWMQAEADAIIVHGQRLREKLLAQSDIPAEKVHVVPHGNFHPIAEHYHKWGRARARASFDLADDESVILFFGYVRPYKGLDTLINACARLGTGQRFRLLIAGRTLDNFWQEGGFAEQIREAGMEGRTLYAIEYVPMEDIARYFLAADIVAMPYKRGSQSGILQMAYAYSKPVVLTDVGSITEVVEDGVTGRVVPPDDPPALAKALGEMLDDPAGAARLGSQGRAYAETALSWDAIAAQTTQIYQTLCSG